MIATDLRIFISYARGDGGDFAADLYERLAAAGFSPWRDRSDIRPGQPWSRMIDRGIAAAGAMLVVLTPLAVRSKRVEGEWMDALERHIPIIPLLIKGSEGKVPRELKGLERLDFRADSGREEAFEQLVKLLRDLPGLHLDRLRDELIEYRDEQLSTTDPRLVQEKVASLEAAIARWESRVQAAAAAEQKPVEVAQLRRSQRNPSKEHRTRVAGEPVREVKRAIFTGRLTEQAEVGRFLADDEVRQVSILGRGGMGKTALAYQLLAGLEVGRWPQAEGGPAVAGIAYLSTQASPGISLPSLISHCARLLDSDGAARLGRVQNSTDLDEKIGGLLQEFGQGLYIVLLDNIEGLLNVEGQPTDRELAAFLQELLGRSGHGLRLLVTSRAPVRHHLDLRRFDRHVSVSEGLSETEGVQLLRALDANNAFGLQSVPDERLTEIVHRTYGIPRALKLVLSILDNDNKVMSIEDVAIGFYQEQEVVEKLIEDSYRLLDDQARKVVEALAVLRVPVLSADVGFMTQPFDPAIDVPAVLRRLERSYLIDIRREFRVATTTLNPIDQAFLYERLPADGAYSRTALHGRAAEYYRSLRSVEPDGHFGLDRSADPETLAPRLAEFEHRIEARQFEEAAEVLAEFGPAMPFAGLAFQCSELVRALTERVESDRSRLTLLACETALRAVLGPVYEALAVGEQARELASRLNLPMQEAAIETLLGVSNRYLSDAAQAVTHYQRALELYRRCEDTFHEAYRASDLSLALSYTGDVRQALHHGRRMLELAEQSGDPYIRFSAHSVLSLAYFVGGRWEDVFREGRAALDAWQPGMPDGKPYVLNTRGMAYLLSGSYPDAVATFHEGVQSALDLQSPRARGFCLYNLALSHYLQGAVAEARKPAREAQPLLSATGLDELSVAVPRLLDAAVSADRAAEARALLECARHSTANPDLFPSRRLATRARGLAAELELEEVAESARQLIRRLDSQLILPDD